MGEEQQCTDVFNCSSDGILRLCFDNSFCDCNPWYGWEGETCDEVSSTLVYHRVMLFALLFIELVMLALFFHFLVFKLRPIYHKIEGKDRILYMALLVMVNLLLLLISSSLQLPALVDPTFFTIREFSIGLKTTVDVLSKHEVVAHSLLIAAVAPLLITGMLMMLSWYSIIKNLGLYFPDLLQQREETLMKGVKVSVPIFVLVLTICLITEQLDLIVGSFIAYLVLANFITYPMLYKYVLKPISEEFVGKASKVTVKKTYDFIVFCHYTEIGLGVVGFVPGVIAYFLYLYKDEVLNPGDFNFISIFRDMFIMVHLTYDTYRYWYLNTTLHNLLKRSSKNTKVNRTTVASSTMERTNTFTHNK